MLDNTKKIKNIYLKYRILIFSILSFSIPFIIYILTLQKKYPEAVYYLTSALPLWEQKTDLDNVASDKRVWVLRCLVYCYSEVKDKKNTIKYCTEWLKIDPAASWPREVLKKLNKGNLSI